MPFPKLLLLAVMFAITAAFTTVAKAQQGPPDPVMTRLMNNERSAHVGEVLPKGIMLMDTTGKLVDLHKMLRQGPAIVLKIRPGCKPCEDLLASIRTTGGHGAGNSRVRIAVIRVGDAGHDDLNLPGDVLQFHSADRLHDATASFFGGQLSPTTFYFDENMKLIKRWPGLPLSPETLLHYPPAI